MQQNEYTKQEGAITPNEWILLLLQEETPNFDAILRSTILGRLDDVTKIDPRITAADHYGNKRVAARIDWVRFFIEKPGRLLVDIKKLNIQLEIIWNALDDNQKVDFFIYFFEYLSTKTSRVMDVLHTTIFKDINLEQILDSNIDEERCSIISKIFLKIYRGKMEAMILNLIIQLTVADSTGKIKIIKKLIRILGKYADPSLVKIPIFINSLRAIIAIATPEELQELKLKIPICMDCAEFDASYDMNSEFTRGTTAIGIPTPDTGS